MLPNGLVDHEYSINIMEQNHSKKRENRAKNKIKASKMRNIPFVPTNQTKV